MKSSIKAKEKISWKQHSEAWKVSGLTQQVYCEQEGISHRRFVYEHNRLMRQLKKAPLNFIEVKPDSAVINNQATELQLMLPNGIRIDIGAEVNPVLLQTVLSVAGIVQCLS